MIGADSIRVRRTSIRIPRIHNICLRLPSRRVMGVVEGSVGVVEGTMGVVEGAVGVLE